MAMEWPPNGLQMASKRPFPRPSAHLHGCQPLRMQARDVAHAQQRAGDGVELAGGDLEVFRVAMRLTFGLFSALFRQINRMEVHDIAFEPSQLKAKGMKKQSGKLFGKSPFAPHEDSTPASNRRCSTPCRRGPS